MTGYGSGDRSVAREAMIRSLMDQVGGRAAAESVWAMLDDNPEMTVAECVAEFQRAQREDVR
jgi:hypothetical protein